MILHTWLIECLKIYGAEENTINFLKTTMLNWNAVLTSSGIGLAEINIRRGIFQDNSLYPLLFVVAMIPMTKVLQKKDAGYQLKKGGSRTNYLMFMDDIKLYGKSIKEIDTLIQIEKCTLVNIQKGKVTRTEGMKLPDGNNIRYINETGYKYLGMIGEDIKHQETKDIVRKEYLQKLKAILKSKLNAGNMTKSISTWAVSTQYKKRHDSVAKALHWSLCKKHQLACSNKWCKHPPEGVIENDQAKILCDYGIRTVG
ncbi:uncharacterized protein [Macrobrachium rosenbergii]|uniref:uncharacterized protein n=1 Tax=Macrobrachium rosenbergii TaxID=79674 RepID=UPI0034D495DE